MLTHGSTVPFQPRPWQEISAFLSQMAARHPEYARMAAVADSVIASGVAGQLAGTTSSESAVITPGVATAGSTDPRIELLVACAAGGAFLSDNLCYLIGRRSAEAARRIRSRWKEGAARPGPVP